jgi:serine/threonine-protein kinase
MHLTLTVTAGPLKGRVFSFQGHDTFLIGRSKHCHFQLPPRDLYCSRIHFLVEVNPPLCRLVDMGSNNGTYVNDQKVAVVDLRPGDKIRAGHSVLHVAVQEEADPAPAAPSGLPVTVALTPSQVVKEWSHAGAPGLNVCEGCGGPLAGSAFPVPTLTQPRAALLCAACQDRARDLPQPLPGWQLLRKLGQGGLGVVYLALRPGDGLAAVKMIAPAVSGSPAQVERFVREAEILRQLHHPHIVAFREIGQAGDELYFVMDYVRGCDAGHLVKTAGPLAVPRAVALTCQLLEALEYAHARQFVHRDVKPANLLVSAAGDRETARLADFGLARVYQASALSGLTLTGEIGGSAGYLAPEQITHFREVLPPADQYGAAATLYYLLTGCPPYDLPRQSHQQFLMILNEDPVPITQHRPELPAALVQIIHRALTRDPPRRFPDVATFRKVLEPHRDPAA